jgi:imidazole glycerol-phosphate synthase subunit HisH
MADGAKITIVDYGVGNIASLVNMFEQIDVVAQLSGDPFSVLRARHILLPGVGSFAHAMENLRSRGLDDAIRTAAADGATVLGVCLGMQLLGRYSEEGDAVGLGLIAGDVRRIKPSSGAIKVPNMGWREVIPSQKTWLVHGDADERFYFAHSFHMICDDPADIAATIDYDGQKTVAVAHERIFGAQFHPEKSHRFGKRLLTDFASQAA